jgi:hypothetical protein
MKKLVGIAEINEAELAVRMCEASYGLRRPAHLTAAQALDAMDSDCREGWRRSAQAAMKYWRECIEKMQSVQ